MFKNPVTSLRISYQQQMPAMTDLVFRKIFNLAKLVSLNMFVSITGERSEKRVFSLE